MISWDVVGLDLSGLSQTMLLSISCYKLACHYFLYLRSTLCIHTCHIFCILLLCFATQMMKSFLMKTSFMCACPRSSTFGVVFCSATWTSWLCNRLCNKTRSIKHWLYYLLFYVWKLIRTFSFDIKTGCDKGGIWWFGGSHRKEAR
jgi:hypothetical protein